MFRGYTPALFGRLIALCLVFFASISWCAQASSVIAFETDEGSWMSLDVSPMGEYLVFELLGDIYQLPIDGGSARPIINGPEFASQPRLSPDGSRLVFVSDRSGEDNLWVAKADGTEQKQLSHRADGELISPAWSRDGQTVYVSQLAGRRSMNTNVELWAYPTDGSAPEKISTPDMGRGSMLVSTFPPGAYGPAPSAQGDEIFFTAAAPRQHGVDAGPSAEIMKVDLSGGHSDTVSAVSSPAFKPMLSSDGKWLAFGALRGNKTGLRLRDLETGDERWLALDIGFNALESWASRDLLPGFDFTPTNDSLVMAYGGKIRRINLASGNVTNIPFSATVSLAVEPRVTTQAAIDQGPVTARLAKGAVISPEGIGHTSSVLA